MRESDDVNRNNKDDICKAVGKTVLVDKLNFM